MPVDALGKGGSCPQPVGGFPGECRVQVRVPEAVQFDAVQGFAILGYETLQLHMDETHLKLILQPAVCNQNKPVVESAHYPAAADLPS